MSADPFSLPLRYCIYAYGGNAMAINENDRARAFRIDPPPAGVFDPRLAAMEMGAFHKTDEAFALEVTGGQMGGAFFVRTEKPRSAVVSYLSLACGTAAVSAHEDWLTLRPDETALVRCHRIDSPHRPPHRRLQRATGPVSIGPPSGDT